MNPFEILGKILQKPQSIAMGASAAFDPLYEDVTRKRLKESTGKDMDRGQALMEGLMGSIAPSDFWSNEARSSGVGKVTAPITNAVMDPMMLAGAATKPLLGATKAGKYADAANTFGKLGEGATKGEKVAQAARRFYQGTMAGGGDATYGLAYAAGGGPAERLIQNAVSRATAKMGAKAASELVGTGVEEAMSQPAVEKLAKMSPEEAMRIAAVPHTNPTDKSYASAMREAAAGMDAGLDTVTGKFPDPVGPGSNMELWKPMGQGTPVDSDPVVRAAREYFKYNPEATATDAIFDLDLPEGSIPKVEMARTPFSNSNPSVPFSDQGALFNDSMMKDGALVPPVGNSVPELPPGPGPARPHPATMSTAVEPYKGQLPPMQQNDVPMGSGTWDIPQRPQGMLDAGSQAMPVGPVGPSSSPVAVPPRGAPPGMDPAKLAAIARQFRTSQNMRALPPGASAPQQEIDPLTLALLKAAGAI